MRADLTLLETTRSGAADLEEQLRQDGRVVHLRGRKMTTLRQLFDEFAAALQFPYYFGANKDAFDECLSEVCEAAAPSVPFSAATPNHGAVASRARVLRTPRAMASGEKEPPSVTLSNSLRMPARRSRQCGPARRVK